MTACKMIQKKVDNFYSSIRHPIYRFQNPMRGAKSRLEALQAVVWRVKGAGDDAVKRWQEVEVKRLEEILQEGNKTGDGLASQVTPARQGEMVERLQEVVKYKICPIVMTWCNTPHQKQIFQTNRAGPWTLKENI